MLGRIALYVFGGALVLGGLLFVLEGVVTSGMGTLMQGAIAAALGVVVIVAGRRLGKATATSDATAEPGAQPVLGRGAPVLLSIVLAIVGVPLVALGLLSLTERPSGPMAELAYILGGGSLVLGAAALYGAWSLFRRGRPVA